MKKILILFLLLGSTATWAQIGTAKNLARMPVDPPCSNPGQVWYNTTSDGPRFCNNALSVTTWGAGTLTPSGSPLNHHLALWAGATSLKQDSACLSDDAGTISGCVSINAASLSSGTAPTACGSATGCFGATAASTTSTQTASQGSCRLDSTTGWWLCRHVNGGAEVPVGSAYIPAASSGAIGAASVANGPSQMITCSATCSWTPISPPVLGAQFCVTMKAGVTGTITLNALGNSAQYGKTDGSAYGTAGTGTAVSTSTTGNQICGYASSTTTYETNSRSTFTMN